MAQVTLYRVHLTRWIGAIRIVAALGIGALVLVNAGVIVLLVGLVLTLATHVGPGWATLIVVAGTFFVAGLLGLLAYRRIAAMSADRAVP